MKLLRNKPLLVLVGMLALATPALAQNYDYLSRSDFISLSAGDAPQANISIQTPTPWPYYVNRTTIHGSAGEGISALEKMYKRFGATGGSVTPYAAPMNGASTGPAQ